MAYIIHVCLYIGILLSSINVNATEIVDYQLYSKGDYVYCFALTEPQEESQYATNIEISRIHKKTMEYECLYDHDIHQVKPWSIDVGNMDGDEDIDIFIGAYTSTAFYEESRRPYLFEWDGSKMYKMWTGSYLNCRDFTEGFFADVTGDGLDELIVYEGNKDSSYHYGAYIFSQYTMFRIDKTHDELIEILNCKNTNE